MVWAQSCKQSLCLQTSRTRHRKDSVLLCSICTKPRSLAQTGTAMPSVDLTKGKTFSFFDVPPSVQIQCD